MSKKVAVFVDVANLYYCINKKFNFTKPNGRKLSYRFYLAYAAKNFGEVCQAYAYGSQINEEAAGFIHALKEIGFMPKFKEHEDKRRINWNAGIAIDIVNVIRRVDTVILGSADADLLPIVEWVQSKGVTVVIMAAGISRTLKEACNTYVEITDGMLEPLKEDAPTSTVEE